MSDKKTKTVAKKKTAKKKVSPKSTKSPKASPSKEFEFNINNLAEDLELAPATVRMKLRKAEIKPDGKAYGWNKTDYLKIKKQLSEG